MRAKTEIQKTHDELKTNMKNHKMYQNVENESYLSALEWVLK